MDNGVFAKPHECSWAFASSVCQRVIGNLGGQGAFCYRLGCKCNCWSRIVPAKSDNSVLLQMYVWVTARRACGSEHICASNSVDQNDPSSSIHQPLCFSLGLDYPPNPYFEGLAPLFHGAIVNNGAFIRQGPVKGYGGMPWRGYWDPQSLLFLSVSWLLWVASSACSSHCFATGLRVMELSGMDGSLPNREM